MRSWVVLVLAMMVGGCGATVSERHYFASYSADDPNTPTNFFRLEVSATSALSSARYVAGYYDERAVDLIFNEIRTGEGDDTPALFTELSTDSGETIRPLSPDASDGVFVMILSTDAESVANVIGGFAERQAVADAVSNLVNRDRIRERVRSDARLSVMQARANAMTSELSASLDAAEGATSAAQAQSAYLRSLNVLARALGRSDGFENFDEARIWFAAQQDAGRGGAP